MEYINHGLNKKNKYIFGRIYKSDLTDYEIKNYGRYYKKIESYSFHKDNRVRRFLNRHLYSNISYNEETFENIYDDGINKFSFYLFSDAFSNKKEKKKYTSYKRLHKCHQVSFNCALESDDPNMGVATGFLSIGKFKVRHTVITYVGNKGTNIIMDYTKNLVMHEEDYCKYFHYEIYSRVSEKDLKEDVKKYKDIINSMYLSHYLFFRDEIVKDLEKNKKVLKLQD